MNILRNNLNENCNIEKMVEYLSSYIEITINEDKSVTYNKINTSYFLENDVWTREFFFTISQFHEYITSWNRTERIMSFRFNNTAINMEIKSIVHYKLFNENLSIRSLFSWVYSVKHLSIFINENYPNINSLLDLDLEKVQIRWVDYLSKQNIKTVIERYTFNRNKIYIFNTPKALLISHCCKYLSKIFDYRDEWEKDKWDVRNLKEYGITYPESRNSHYVDFSNIKNINLRKEIKIYIKRRLQNRSIAWGTAQNYVKSFTRFNDFISEYKNNWNDLKGLVRKDIEDYVEYLNNYASNKLKSINSNPTSFVHKHLIYLQKILSDFQTEQYKSSIAPIKDIRILIFPDDAPKSPRRAYDDIKYVPDFVLEQLFQNFHKLQSHIQPVIRIMFETGLRISDTLELKQECLIKLNNKFYIKTDIEKTFVKNHRIPITDNLASIISSLIELSIKNSNENNNPKKYIFVRYSGKRKGKPYSQSYISDRLNVLSMSESIVDEMNNPFYFHNHAFRHTYAVKLLNSGVDILTVQDLLAHASPEMTLNYAKLLDDTKRKQFENAVKQGVFSFNTDGKLYNKVNEIIPKDILDMLRTNHKINAIDTPYGTCMQRSKGRCSFAKQPPCLTCNAGKPCKDLGVGIFEGDMKKYEIHINSTKAFIEQAEIYRREDMAKENKELLNLYEEIYTTIANGNIVYGRLDRLMREGDSNE